VNKNKFLLIAALAFVMQFGVMAYMIVRREITLKQGELYCFKTAPVDPNDVFRGRHVRVDVDGDGPFTNALQFKRGQKLFGTLEVDSNGITRISSIDFKRPEADIPFITVRCKYSTVHQTKRDDSQTNYLYYCRSPKNDYWRWRSAEEVSKYNLTYTKVRTNVVAKYKLSGRYVTSIEMPFDRYYMDEKVAPEAERLYLEHSARGKQDTLLNVRVHRGYALIESLTIGGKSIRDMAKGE